MSEPKATNQQTGPASGGNQALVHESSQSGRLTPPDFSDPVKGLLFFSRYIEDGKLRLYKKGSMLSDEPAGYSEDPVTVKILIVRENEQFMVVLPIRRAMLDEPGIEQYLANCAWSWRR